MLAGRAGSGTTPRQCASVAVTCSARAGMQCSPGTECVMALRNRARADAIVEPSGDRPAPGTAGARVTSCGSPRTRAMFRRTHSSAADLVEQAAVGRSAVEQGEPFRAHSAVDTHDDEPRPVSTAGSYIGSPESPPCSLRR
ncbi:hypothetical protein SCALM49S_02404 [Streptomyces californicus]